MARSPACTRTAGRVLAARCALAASRLLAAHRTLAGRRALAGSSHARSSQDSAASSAALGSEEVVVSDELVPVSKELASEELFAGSASVFADSDETFVDVEEVPDSVEEVITGSEEVFADSVEQVAASVDMVADSIEMVPDSVVPDSIELSCPRCGTFHVGGVFGEECYQDRREARRCARCRLVHEDYDLTAKWLHNMEKFDCEIFIPDVDKLVMRGDSIFLSDAVMKKLDEHYNAMKKLEEEAKTVHDGIHDQ